MPPVRTAALIAVLAAGPLSAEDAAVALGVERYERLGRVAGAEEVARDVEVLRDFGFSVAAVPNARAGNAISALDAWAGASGEARRLVAALSGRFVTDGERTWLLAADSAAPTLFGLGDRAISVDSVLDVLAQRPGQALLLLGYDSRQEDEADRFLDAGIGDLDVPGGVTVISGPPDEVAEFIDQALAVPGGNLMALVEDYRDLEVTGFAPDTLRFLPARAADPQPVRREPSAAETALWQGSQALDTVEAYRNYIARYPDGIFRPDAERAIAEIIAEPNRAERLGEQALGLSLGARRGIQEDLTLLGYNTRGVDGIFGEGTRGAIRNWQQQNGFAQSSYLNAEQISLLQAQSARRQSEITAEEERRRAEAERIEAEYWRSTGAEVGNRAGFVAYLERYPQGQFADIARQQLEELASSDDDAEAEERRAWRAAADLDSEAAYRAFIDAYPQSERRRLAEVRLIALELPRNADEAWRQTERDGSLEAYRAFRRAFPDDPRSADATERIRFLRQSSEAEGDTATAETEAALGLTPFTLRLIESGLAQMGHDPGPPDGVMDERTRRALADFQDEVDLPPTGYLNRPTISRLVDNGLEALR